MTTPRHCELCKSQFPTRYKLINHLRRDHQKTWRDYVLENMYNGIPPMCKCGCKCQIELSTLGSRDHFNDYIHGHNGVGKSPSYEIRERIGRKNSTNMKQYHAEHPELAAAKATRMREFITDDTIIKRSESIRQTYEANPELRESLGEKVRQFWKDNLQKREETTIKQRVTYNTRATQGAYLLTNQHLSEVMSNKLLNNERIWQRGEYKAIKCPKTCRYKSSYELTIMQDLDASDAVASWNYECVSIRYIDETEHKTRRYVPDFLITLKSGKIIMLEAKPFKLSTHPRVMCKTKAGVAYCKEMNITYIMWWPEMGSIDEVLQHKTLKDKDTQP